MQLLGQNVNSYRGEGADGTWDFPDLIRAVNDIEGIERIRFMTSHPKDLSDKLIDCFRDCSKLCHYFHLPVQSGSTEVLKRMNRRYDRERYLDLVKKLREVGYDSAFTFLYSIRKGTHAAVYEDQVPEEIKHERFNRLCDEINATSAVKNAAYVGRVLDVLCDGPSKRNSRSLSGRTDTFKLVNFRGDPGLQGKMVKVKITSSNTFSLEGELV